MKKNIIFTLAITALIAGCSTGAQHGNYAQSDAKASSSSLNVRVEIEQEKVDEAEVAVRDALKDPESAKFRDIHGISVSEDGPVMAVCGEVNAKNSYGGYIGFNRFAYTGGKVHLWQRTRGINVDNSIVEFTCDT